MITDETWDAQCRVVTAHPTVRVRSPPSSVSDVHAEIHGVSSVPSRSWSSVLLETRRHVFIYFLNPEFSLSFDGATHSTT